MSTASQNFAKILSTIVGSRHVQEADSIPERYRTDITRKYSSSPAWLAKPGSTEEVASILREAAMASIAVTVVGGQTGLVGSAIASNGGLALSLERMNRILELDPLSMTMTVEAGCIVQLVQEAAEREGAFFPLDLGSRGSATIGGVIGTNAGGNRVVRWGMMRDMVIGLEAVLADGMTLSSLTKMIKDNAGYHWKNLMIGSEGTLGVVTKAVLRLRPLPTTRQTALIAAPCFRSMIAILRRLEISLSGQLSSFELMWEDFYAAMSEAQLPRRPRPMATGHGVYALVEAMGGNEAVDTELFNSALAALLEEGLVDDAVIANSVRERDALWALREDFDPLFAGLRPLLTYDVSMAITDMPAFIEEARMSLRKAFPDVSAFFYGHAGDGNLHAVVSVGHMDDDVQRSLDSAIYGAVRKFGGSISAEHGIGVSRRPYLAWTRSEAELALMKRLKNSLDPGDILNPGKLFTLAFLHIPSGQS